MNVKKIDTSDLTEFEKGLDISKIENSKIQAKIVGYGEISSIFKIKGFEGWIYKRLPLFETKKQAEDYAKKYEKYVDLLKTTGLHLPDDFYRIVNGHKNVVLYLAQHEIRKEDLCQNRLHLQTDEENLIMLQKIFLEIQKVFRFNEKHKIQTELSIDGQISNWAMEGENLLYFDTSTPLFKLHGIEQMNPDLILSSAPKFLIWMIKLFFLQDVMERYYDIRLVFIDVIANLYKEQKISLIDSTIVKANKLLPESIEKIKRKEVDKYYKEDKFIWQLFLGLRRFDRWITTKIFRKRYEFILPGKIKR